MRSSLLPTVVAGLLVILFLWGLEQVAVAPLETGEVYPPYSSLRFDPLGARALYESLAALPDLQVERLYKPRATMVGKEAGTGAAVLVLGVDPLSWSEVNEKTLEEYEKLTDHGGRLVIAFLPIPAPANSAGEQQSLASRWHIRLAYRDAPRTTGAIPRSSALYFDAGQEWNTLALRDGHASAVERDLGDGTVVLVADSYPLSNEGLRQARDAGFISRVVGPARRIVFDENHFGVVETGSVTKLMRKYRLQGAVAILVVVAILFVWRSGSSFLPPRAEYATGPITGRDSMEGLAALLRRGVAEKDLLETCFSEWRKTAPREGRAARVEQEIARVGKHHPVEAYRAASRVLTEKA
jgi:hypothetical protein